MFRTTDRRRRRRLVLGAMLGVLGTFAAPSAGAEGDRPLGSLEVVGERAISPRLRDVTFRTPALDHATTVRILLPDGFDPSGAVRYPVLYLLHGGGDSYRSWTEKGDVSTATAGLPLIVVMPDNNRHGNYVDWYNHGAGGPPMWETFIIGQLLPWVDRTFPTVGTRDGRAVAGLSMGGGGAMGYAARHPDVFTAAAAFSGAVDTNTVPVQLLVETSGVEDGHALGAVHGHRLANEVRWRGHNPWDLAPNLRGLLLHLRTGNGLPGGPGGDLGDPVEFAVRQMMSNLHDRLTAFDIDHVWDDYGAGGHDWFYWRRGLRQFLPAVMNRFDRPVPAPEIIDFRAIESDYQVFGWDVSLTRPAVEFSRLAEAGPDGFEVHGSGEATVVTPAHYRPGQTLAVEIDDSDGTRRVTSVADDDGRLAVDLALGPSNPHRQFTADARLWMLANGHDHWPVHTVTVGITTVEASPVESVPAVAGPPASLTATPGARRGLPATGGATRLAHGVALVGLVLVGRSMIAGRRRVSANR